MGMNPVHALLQLRRTPAVRAFDTACKNVESAQRDYLLAHLTRHADTVFGRQNGFGRIRSVDDFRQAVPVVGYDAFSPYIDRMLHGEANVLVPEKVQFWSATAGTTGYRKLVPITEKYREEFQLSMHLWLHGVGTDHPDATSGQVVYFVATPRVDVAPDGTLIGNMSGFNFQKVPAILRRKYAVPLPAFEIRDPEARAYTVARIALAQDITWLIAISSHPLHALFETLRGQADALLKDVRDGTLTADVPQEIRTALAPLLVPNAARVREVERNKGFAGGLTPRAAWPRLKLMTSWTHGAAAAFLPDVMAAAPGIPVRGGMYAASEGWFTVPRADGDAPGVLVVNTNFYEFIPVDASGQDAGAAVLAHQLEDRRRYNLVITTGAGLARYRMDDVVEVDGFVGQAPRLRFIQKAGSALNLYHDLTTEAQARTAVEHVQKGGAPLGRWALAVSPTQGPYGRARYVLFAETPAPLDAEGREALSSQLDNALQDANYNYRKDRGEGIVAPLVFRPLKPGALARVQVARARAGHAGDQMKPIVVIKDAALRDLVDAEAHA